MKLWLPIPSHAQTASKLASIAASQAGFVRLHSFAVCACAGLRSLHPRSFLGNMGVRKNLLFCCKFHDQRRHYLIVIIVIIDESSIIIVIIVIIVVLLLLLLGTILITIIQLPLQLSYIIIIVIVIYIVMVIVIVIVVAPACRRCHHHRIDLIWIDRRCCRCRHCCGSFHPQILIPEV